MIIPKKIHYCWFGYGKKSKLVKDCIKSWKKYLPDFEIIEWNEDNCDLSHPFVKKAYDEKMWAFVSDFIRIKKIYEYGGIYLDTDMMVIKPMIDLLKLECFIGGEKTIVAGGIMGSTSNNVFFENCLKQYDNFDVTENFNWGTVQIPKVLTSELEKISKSNFNFHKGINSINGISVFSYEYFYPFPFDKKNDLHNYRKYILPETIAVHLWAGSWLPKSRNEFFYFRNRYYLKGLKIVLKVLLSNNRVDYKYFRKILSSVKESITKK